MNKKKGGKFSELNDLNRYRWPISQIVEEVETACRKRVFQNKRKKTLLGERPRRCWCRKKRPGEKMFGKKKLRGGRHRGNQGKDCATLRLQHLGGNEKK